MNAFYITKRIFKQTIRDIRTLMLLLVAPLLTLTLFYYIFTVSDNSNGVKVGVHDIPESLKQQLQSQDITIENFKDHKNIDDKIKEDQLTGFILMQNHELEVTFANDNPTDKGVMASTNQKWLTNHNMSQLKENTKSLKKALAQVQSQIPDNANTGQSMTENREPIKINTHYLYGDKDATYFDTINPILIGFFVFFFTFLISGIGLLKERTSGTLERLLSSPIKRSHIIYGYIMGYGIFSVIQTFVVVIYAIYVLNIAVEGSIWLVLATTVLTALVALTFGILLSTFASSEFQMIQFIPLVIVPQVLFAGLIPISSMNIGLQYFAHLMPLFYTGEAMQDVMIKGFGVQDIYINLCVLFGIFVVLLILNILGMKRYRKV
ncbi:ABC transporter permease [Staphylococcus cohnii]|uniref:ABC transporter permease n=2 Tax=Staphylococcus cohnii TaxID=29382 RepID=A0ABT6IYV4_9STAP|nr:ABC transporter permease [Staphylococcus cohnii]AYX90809.1 ABC transporter permease [Staphylococcus cohnii]KKI65373.1 ABC transporter, permease protein [Staphylococcus cohnii subsp. cohnii]MCI2941238.1 ABC transporter permease [Staphylococcus cohnii]MDE1710596.1 ABC transporter permease [Staphylococcus cohnii]MDH5139807.1 ABC transporter permease [Staphylococcus cohnii]